MSDIFWQAPGNGSAFNTNFENMSNKIKGKVNTKNRTLGILNYIKINQPIKINKSNEKVVRNFLFENYYIEENKTNLTHLYNPALFFGFIQKNNKNELTLSIEGELFLNSYVNKLFDKCKELFINQLDNTIYPNKATSKSNNLKLFPFRILFKLLLEQNKLSQDFINNSLVKISKIDELKNYISTNDLNDIKSHNISSHRDTKFNDWITQSLVSVKILDRDKNRYITINNSIIFYIKKLYENITYKDCFFDNTTCEINNKVSKERYKRDPKLILEAKERDEFICQVNKEHITFKSKGKNYVEGHHIIPMYQQKNYDFILDNVDNILSLCPTSHREIHYSDNKKDILDKVYSINNIYFKEKDIEKIELYKMYSCE
ncbi:MAG: hypothetical protein U9Q30_09865 [Campylobacterota bacterium]|nr:hypothetical protein [Campylobacterota bacterium]